MSSFNNFIERLQYLEEGLNFPKLPKVNKKGKESTGSPESIIKRRMELEGLTKSLNYHPLLFLASILIDDDLQPTGRIISDEEHTSIEKAKIKTYDPGGIGGGSGIRRVLSQLVAKYQKKIDSVTNFQEVIDKNLSNYVAQVLARTGKKEDVEDAVEDVANDIEQNASEGESNSEALVGAINDLPPDEAVVKRDTEETGKLAGTDPTTMIEVRFSPAIPEITNAIKNFFNENIQPEDIELMEEDYGSIVVSVLPSSTVAKLVLKVGEEKVEKTIINELRRRITNIKDIRVVIISPGQTNLRSSFEDEEAEEFNTNNYLDIQTQKDAVTHRDQTIMVPHREYMRPKTIHQAVTYAHTYGINR